MQDFFHNVHWLGFEDRHDQRLKEAELERLVRRARGDQPKFQDRMLHNLGKQLILVGMRLKSRHPLRQTGEPQL